MKVITVHEKGLRRAKILILINTIFILVLGFYFVYAHIINQFDNNFLDKYLFLHLLIMFLGFETMLMSVSSANSSYRSNPTSDNAMFTFGVILEVVAFVTIFLCILINKLNG